ncbi:PREDICTED: probable glycosyltransferase At5g03795 isoform X2 [Nelumbo nucifera]|uniref:Exostosin GT47 domain-containing protein n=2 Tax=Nelumbo nucifera TaxID=4432 RepID=A0A822YPI0_NELNU|nr:PREDICTED: probable glycosyltransferase At5g03795 isoform X2 [Nelumbo nucifera]DAD34003.1 TPA_asm: hypothetical protein HUJ06_004643 [Nelumbo nucifera]
MLQVTALPAEAYFSKRRPKPNFPYFGLHQRRLLVPLLVVVVTVAVASLLSIISFHGLLKLSNTPPVQFVESKLNTQFTPSNTLYLAENISTNNKAAAGQTSMVHPPPSPPPPSLPLPPPPPTTDATGGPYHNWELFSADFNEMLTNLKIFVYPDVFTKKHSSPSAPIFLPHPNPLHPKLGNYYSEHMFKIALLGSSLLTTNPEEAHFFFMPFSINALRNDPRVRSEASIANFVAQYTARISWEYIFWNASEGSDHFYVFCHSVGRDAASKHQSLYSNAIQVTCSSSYFQRFYVSHKDVGLPQVWPRPPEEALNPPDARLVFFAGRIQNSQVRQELVDTWANDTCMDIFSGNPPFPYEEGFRRSKYCLHVKGYEVNTARISDAIYYGCIPVIISNHYDLPFANVLDWSKFSVIISHRDIALVKRILLSISRQLYLRMHNNLCKIRRHFKWHTTPKGYDSFHMTAYQLWLRRGIHGLPY